MPAQVITNELMTINTRSTDLVAGANMTTCNANDTFTITPDRNDMRLTVVAIKGSGSATVTFNAGTYPPGIRSGLGSLAITIANSEVRLLTLDATRFFSNAKPATITGTVTGATALLGLFVIPRTV